jgi:lyso-ornithine lipid O-acyltransferase
VGSVRDAEALVKGLRLRSAARIARFGAVTAVLLPAFVARRAMASATGLGESGDALRDRWVRVWSSTLLRTFGVHLVTTGDVPARGRGHLVVANHRSTADVLALLNTFGGRMVSRADLANWPLVGPAARAVGTIFVDRADAASGAGAVRAIRTQLAAGSTVILFPEGTTYPGDDVRPFHSGAFIAALRSGADIVPVGLAYQTGSGAAFVNESFAAHLARMADAEPSRVAMCIGSPIGIAERARAAHLAARAQADVQRLVASARALVDRP